MMGSPVNKDAVNVIQAIPADTIGAEVGVWMGNTSQKFLDKGLKHLHLVDSWSPIPYEQQPNNEHGSYEQYLAKYSHLVGSTDPSKFDEYYDKIYQGVVDRFDRFDNVTIHRMTSKEFFEQFSYNPEKLDWIYVDGDHSYEGCLYDLEQSLKAVKKGGKIFGDDYRWTNAHGKPGVTQAVDEFVKKYSLTIKRYGILQFEIEV